MGFFAAFVQTIIKMVIVGAFAFGGLSLDVICENEKMIKRRMPRSSGVR